jgi:hypothetical protein
MKNFISKLEKKFGKYAIRRISLYLALLYGVGYVIQVYNPHFLDAISLNPYAIIRGEVWRLITWIMIPPAAFDPLWTLLSLFFFYRFGMIVEQTIGTFRFNIYLFSGLLFTILGAFVLMIYTYIADPLFIITAGNAVYFSTYYVKMSVFLAMAVILPEMQIFLMFIIPIKMKYMGMVYGLLITLDFIRSGMIGRFVIIASLLNFLIFFYLIYRNKNQITTEQKIRRAVYRQEIKKVKTVTRHKCAVCGVTDEQEPEREFRFCSKCKGSYEYCDQHLYTHSHVTSEPLGSWREK